MSKKTLKVKNLLFKTSLYPLSSFFSNRRYVAILRYHSILGEQTNDYVSPNIALPVKAFEQQIQYFSKRYNIISMDEVAECLRNYRPFPKRAVAITFDDGYRDNYSAFRILKKYGVSGTFYVVAGCVGVGAEPLWLFEVIYLIRNTRHTHLYIKLSGRTIYLNIESDDEKNAAIRTITSAIKCNNLRVRECVRKQLRDQFFEVVGLEESASKIMLTWKQLQEMSDSGMIIGGHTMTHLNLPNADLEDARREIFDCKKLLEKRLNRSIKHFSYPNGGNYEYYNDVIMNLVREAGFLTSTTSNNGLADIDSNALELRRVRVTPNMSEIHYQMEWEPLVDRWIHLIGKRSD